MHVACFYKLFDELQDGPKTPLQVASKLKLELDNLKRLLWVLANHGVLTIKDNDQFYLNAISELLVSTRKNSLQPSIAKEFDERRWAAIGHINLALETDISPFHKLYNESFYQYIERDSKAAELFHKGMENFSKAEDEEIANIYNFSCFNTICAVGGGTGSLIREIFKLYPAVNAILFDLKEAIEISSLLHDSRFQHQVKGVVGNFFLTTPLADAFLIKRVLHNWEDEECIKILQNCVHSLNDSYKGRILIMEKVLPPKIDGSLLFDINLFSLALGIGKERNLGEFITIGKESNLELKTITEGKTGITLMVFEVRK